MVGLPCITKAVIFDVDGTLDDQRKLRLFMAWEMVICVLRQRGVLGEATQRPPSIWKAGSMCGPPKRRADPGRSSEIDPGLEV